MSVSPKQTTLVDLSTKPAEKLASTTKHTRGITKALGEFIAKDMRPVALVEGEGFLHLMSTLEPAPLER